MRVLLVGSASGRARLRAELAATSIDVVAEFPSLAAARASDVDSDAIVVSPDAADDGHFEEARNGDGDGDPEVVEALTQREVQVLELLAEGLPNKAIADRLKISDQTVKFHVSSISAKLGAANRTDAVRRAVRRGLIAL
jgi:two-component system, NarL family, response regulator YdfI